MVSLCAPWFVLRFTKARIVKNPLHKLDFVECFYHNNFGNRCTDWKTVGAVANFIDHYATTQLGKTGLEFVEDTSDNPNRLDDVKTWAQQKYNIKFNEVMTEGTVLLEPPSPEEMIAAEKLLRDAVIAHYKFPSLAKDEMKSLFHSALEDLKDRPRYEKTRIEHYIEIAYDDCPGLTETQIRQKFIKDWA